MGSSPKRNTAARIRDISYKNGNSILKEYEGYRFIRNKVRESKKKLNCRPPRNQAASLIEIVPQTQC